MVFFFRCKFQRKVTFRCKFQRKVTFRCKFQRKHTFRGIFGGFRGKRKKKLIDREIIDNMHYLMKQTPA